MSNKKITTKIETISPEMAKVYLEGQGSNRKAQMKMVAKFAADLSAGEWSLNGETVKFDENGQMIDGQKRMMAIIRTGIPMTTVVVRGLPSEAIFNVDTGQRRTGGDFLTIHGFRNGSQKSAVSRFYLDMGVIESREAGVSILSFGKGRQLNQKHLIDFVTANNDRLDESISYVFSRTSQHLLHSPSVFGAIFLRFADIDPDLARNFMEILLLNENYTFRADGGHYALGSQNPIWRLRHFLEDEREFLEGRVNASSKRLAAGALVGVAFKAWNLWLEGKSMTEPLSYSRNEGWPILLTPADVQAMKALSKKLKTKASSGRKGKKGSK